MLFMVSEGREGYQGMEYIFPQAKGDSWNPLQLNTYLYRCHRAHMSVPYLLSFTASLWDKLLCFSLMIILKI